MVKVNDKVFHAHNMSLRGTVVGIEQEKSQIWMVGGATQPRIIALVQLQDGRVLKLPAADLMRD